MWIHAATAVFSFQQQEDQYGPARESKGDHSNPET
jgi:hypothetical protein